MAAGTTAHVVVDPSVIGTAHVKLGVPVKPFSRVSAKVPLPQAPLFTVSWVCVKASEKSTEVAAFAVLAGETVVQFVTTTNTSIDPNPVAKSYPAEALYPIIVDATQGGLKGTSLFPVWMSWKAVAGRRVASG